MNILHTLTFTFWSYPLCLVVILFCSPFMLLSQKYELYEVRETIDELNDMLRDVWTI